MYFRCSTLFAPRELSFSLDISVIRSTLMILTDGLIPFLLHLEKYLVYEKGHTIGHCHQLRLLLVVLLLSMAGSKH